MASGEPDEMADATACGLLPCPAHATDPPKSSAPATPTAARRPEKKPGETRRFT